LTRYILYISVLFSSLVGYAQLSPEEERYVDSLKTVAEKTKSDTIRVNALLEWDNHIYFFDPESDLKINERIEEVCLRNLKNRSLSKKEELFYKDNYASSLNNMGLIYRGKGDYVRSIDLQTRSLKIREEIGDKEGVGSSLNNIGLIYQDQGDFKKAIEYHKKSLQVCEEINYKKGASNSLGNLATIYTSLKEYPKAIDFASRSMKISEEIGDMTSVAGTNNNIGIIYQEMAEVSKSIEYLTKGLEIFEKIGNKKGVAVSLNCLGSVSLDRKDYQAAIEFCSKALIIAQEIESVIEIKSACSSLYIANKAIGNYDKALMMHERFIRVRDSINNENNKRELARQEFKYEYDKKVTADSIREVEEMKIVSAQIEEEQTQRYGLYGGVLLLLIFGAFMFNRFRVAKKQKAIIESQKEIVEEKQKEILDSIYYAKRIQNALLPTSIYIAKNLKRLKDPGRT